MELVEPGQVNYVMEMPCPTDVQQSRLWQRVITHFERQDN